MTEPVDDLVTVVVPTRQVIRTIEACLRSVRAQDHLRVELVVVDNGSTDGSVEVAKRFADRVASGGPERSAQRNQGVELARGDWVMWIDADMVLPPETVRLALRTARRAGAVAVSVPEVSTGDGFWTACRTLERRCYLDDPGLYYPRLIRRDLLRRLGGFATSMAGPEDVDLRRRLDAAGAVLAHCPQVLIEHDEGHLTLAAILRKRVYYGRSLPAFARSNPGGLSAQGRDTVAAFVRHRRELARHPVLSMGIVLMRAAEAVAYGAGYLRGYLDTRVTVP